MDTDAPINASALRANIYNILDEILASGQSIEIERKGRRLRIVPDKPASKLDHLRPCPGFEANDSDDLPDLHWDAEWKPSEL